MHIYDNKYYDLAKTYADDDLESEKRQIKKRNKNTEHPPILRQHSERNTKTGTAAAGTV